MIFLRQSFSAFLVLYKIQVSPLCGIRQRLTNRGFDFRRNATPWKTIYLPEVKQRIVAPEITVIQGALRDIHVKEQVLASRMGCAGVLTVLHVSKEEKGKGEHDLSGLLLRPGPRFQNAGNSTSKRAPMLAE